MRPVSFSQPGAVKGALKLGLAALPGVAALWLPSCGSVQLQRPAGLWAWTALVPLIAVHLLVPERRAIRVSSLALWRAVVAKTQSASPRLRLWPFWREPGFWLHASLVGLLACSLASPTWLGRGEDPAVLLLIDRGATMALPLKPQPGAPARTRDALARQRARAQAETELVPVGLVAQSAGRRLTLPPGEPTAVIAAIDALAAPAGWDDLPQLLGTARRLQDDYGGELRIMLLSDNVDGAAERALRDGPLAASCSAGFCTLVVVGDDGPQPDVALVDAPAQVREGVPFRLQLVNSGAAPVVRRVQFAREPAERSESPTIESREYTLEPGRSSVTAKLPQAGCWHLSLPDDDALTAGNFLTIAAHGAAAPVCVVETEAEHKSLPVAAWLNAANVPVLGGDSAIPYDAARLTELAGACSLLIFVEPKGHESILEQRAVQGRDWLLLFHRDTAPFVVSQITAAIPPLAELEPRLLPLTGLLHAAQLWQEPGAKLETLAAVIDAGDEQPAISRWQSGTRRRTAVSLRWPVSLVAQEESARRLLATVAIYDDHDLVSAAAVTDHVPDGARVERLCPASQQSARADGQGLYTPLRTGAAARTDTDVVLRVSALDPALATVAARRTALSATPARGRRERALWPLLLGLALLCSLIEQGLRNQRERAL